MRKSLLVFFSLVVASSMGCSSTRSSNTARTGIEQLLISNAIDQALDKVRFDELNGEVVFVDDKYLDCVDKNYVVGATRRKLLQSGAHLVEARDNANVVLEVHSGAVGTDTKETFLGVPEIAVPIPLPVSVPEIKLISKSVHSGTAKLSFITFDAKTNRALAGGGVALAQSDNSNIYVLGMGPIHRGTIKSEMSVGLNSHGGPSGMGIALRTPDFSLDNGVQLASPQLEKTTK